MLEVVLDGHDFHSGFVKAAALGATAAVREHTALCVPKHHPEGWDGAAAQWDRGDLKAQHVHLHCSGSMVQMGIQDPEGAANTCWFLKHRFSIARINTFV